MLNEHQQVQGEVEGSASSVVSALAYRLQLAAPSLFGFSTEGGTLVFGLGKPTIL